MKKLIKDERGAMYSSTIFITIAILLIALFASEYMRVYDLRQHIADELGRAINLGVKTAMEDSRLWDRERQIDEAIARDAFYYYLKNDMGLNSNLEKYEGDKLMRGGDLVPTVEKLIKKMKNQPHGLQFFEIECVLTHYGYTFERQKRITSRFQSKTLSKQHMLRRF